jgi:hypothetical protein
MKKYQYWIGAGLLFLILTGVISFSSIRPMLIPSQEARLNGSTHSAALVHGRIFLQEFTLKEDYIHGMQLLAFNTNVKSSSHNVLLLMDSANAILSQTHFSSDLAGPYQDYISIPFENAVNGGKGRKMYLGLYSPDATESGFVSVASNFDSTMGKMYAMPLPNDDVASAMKNKDAYVVKGTFGYKTFESSTPEPYAAKIALIIAAFLLSLCLVSPETTKSVLIRIRMVPEKIFIPMGLCFGILLAIVTPPLQVPDGAAHFVRANGIAELDIFKFSHTIPASFTKFFLPYDRLRTNIREKIQPEDILAGNNIPLNPSIRSVEDIAQLCPDYVIPYIPQSISIAIAKMFFRSPLALFYLARLGNLLTLLLLIYFAIKITPVGNWVFFLLGLMPMTLFQAASSSYDGLLIALSMLLIALFLRYALDDEKNLGTRDLLLLFGISILLALCKPPYYLLIVCFLFIPVRKIGSRVKYYAIFLALICSVVIATQSWSVSRSVFATADHSAPSHDSPNGLLKGRVSFAGMTNSCASVSGNSAKRNLLFRSSKRAPSPRNMKSGAFQQGSKAPPDIIHAAYGTQPKFTWALNRGSLCGKSNSGVYSTSTFASLSINSARRNLVFRPKKRFLVRRGGLEMTKSSLHKVWGRPKFMYAIDRAQPKFIYAVGNPSRRGIGATENRTGRFNSSRERSFTESSRQRDQCSHRSTEGSDAIYFRTCSAIYEDHV